MSNVIAWLLLLSTSAFYLLTSPKMVYARIIGYLLAAIVFFTGLLKIWGLAWLPFHLGLVSTEAAFSFMILGAALLLINYEAVYGFKPSHYLALLLSLPGMFSLLGHLYHVEEYYGIRGYIPMSIQTAACFFLFALALLFIYPATGVMRELTGTLIGSVTARLLIPVAVILPAGLGLLRLFGTWAGAYNDEFGVAIFVLSITVILISVIWYITSLLNKRDLKRKSAEDRFLSLFEAAPDATIIINDRGTMKYVNRQATLLFGYSLEEMLDHQAEILMPEDKHERYFNFRAGLFANKNPEISRIRVEVRAVRKDGSAFPVEISVAPIITNEGTFVTAAVRDISERKQLELKLKQFNELLSIQVEEKTQEVKEILDRLSDAFIRLDARFCYTYLNKKAEELLHVSQSDLIGKNVWDIFPAAVDSETYKAMNRAMDNQQYTVNTDYFRPLDLWQENHIYPSPNGLSVFIRNITESKRAELALKQSEIKYRTFIEEAVDAVFVFSLSEGRYTDVNKKASELLGYTEDELTRMSPEDLVFPDDPVPIQIYSMKFGESLVYERRLKRKDGSGVEAESSIRKLADGNFLAFIRDVTERKQSEAERRRLTEELRKLADHLQDIREEERTHIAREIHDELGQQLTVIKMDLSWLRKKLPDQGAEVLRNKVNELLQMVDESVKTVRRIASELRPSLLDDMGLVAAMEWHLEEFEKRSGIEKEAHLPAREILLPEAIKIGLFRILQESLTNVARHSGANKVIVQFGQTNNKITLNITDNGKGLNSGHAAKKTLGLLGMQERVNMMGGEYKLAGKPGAGTTVSVEIPLTEEVS